MLLFQYLLRSVVWLTNCAESFILAMFGLETSLALIEI